MPRRARGPRIALTIRLPFDLYREVGLRAEARNWSMSDFVAYCVERDGVRHALSRIAAHHRLPSAEPEHLATELDARKRFEEAKAVRMLA